ncbi:MAG: ATP-binding cassette domain-containing protein [Pirellulaceae bacterium]
MSPNSAKVTTDESVGQDGDCWRGRDIRRRRGDFVLHLADWRVALHGVTALLGPTGSGKSTLLELLAGVGRADEGVWLDPAGAEFDPTSLSSRRRVTWVAQRPTLVAGTVIDNLSLGLKLRGQECTERVDRVLEQWGLREIARRRVDRLSGGQTQLVALARAMVVEPDLLLLDEPTNGLDPQRVALVEQLVGEAVATRGMTVVWTTHLVFQVRRIARHWSFLWEGELLAEGAVEELDSPTQPELLRRFLTGELPS